MRAGFVRAALARGEEVAVWNRTPDKGRALEACGYDVLPGIAAFFDRALAAGHGAEDVGAAAALR
jgi:hypothetical protein